MIGDLQGWHVSDMLRATGGRLVSGEASTPWKTVSTDSRTIEEGDFFIALTGENYDGHRFIQDALAHGGGGAIVSEAYVAAGKSRFQNNPCIVAVPDPLTALGDIARFRRRKTQVAVIAVTGTNGKTTTKEMTANVLEQSFSVLRTQGNFNNLIGVPLTLLRLAPDHEWAVLELGMNRPGEIKRLAQICDPQVGLITNIAPGHLEGVKDLEGVMAAKGELLEVLGEKGTAVLNLDDPRIRRLADQFHGEILGFGLDPSAHVWADAVTHTVSGCTFDLHWRETSTPISMKTPGLGTVYNALASAAVGYRLGLSTDQIRKGLEMTAAVPGRMEVITLPGGIHLIDDTYNANPGSMAQAIDTLNRLKGNSRGILITGDMLELGEQSLTAHRELGALAAGSDINHLYTTGDFADTVAEGAKQAGLDADRISVCTQEEILRKITKHLAPGDWVLVKGSRLMAMENIVKGLRAKSIRKRD